MRTQVKESDTSHKKTHTAKTLHVVRVEWPQLGNGDALVHGDIEKPLYLRSVEIHGLEEQTGRPGGLS